MKAKYFVIVPIIFALILALGMVGGSWTTTDAHHGTVPTRRPTKKPPHRPPTPTPRPHHFPPPHHRWLIPVTGDCAGADFTQLGAVSLCIPDGGLDKTYEVDVELATITPGAGQIVPFSPVFNVYMKDGSKILPNFTFSEDAALTLDLTADALAKYEKNNKASLMWFNPHSAKWQKIASTVNGTQLLANISTTGLFVLAVPK